MMKKVRLNPDGVPMNVDWNKFTVGSSIFIPCVNSVKGSKQVKHITAKLGMLVQVTTRIENDKWGIRVWRTL
jgi:hypothetical protein